MRSSSDAGTPTPLSRIATATWPVSGWLVVILPAFLYFDDFRAWSVYRERWLVAPVALLLSIGVGLGVPHAHQG